MAAHHYSVDIWWNVLHTSVGLIDFAQRLAQSDRPCFGLDCFFLTRECQRCSNPQGKGLRSRVIAYWLASAWHVSRFIAVNVSSPTQLSSVNVVRYNWHLFKRWRLTTGQGYCIIKSIQINYTVNESTSNEARYHIDMRLPWNPAKDHRTG